MGLVIAPHCVSKVVHQHLANAQHSAGFVKKILCERRSSNFRHMLVLRDCRDLLLVQTAKCDAILQGDVHSFSSWLLALRSQGCRTYWPGEWLVAWRSDSE